MSDLLKLREVWGNRPLLSVGVSVLIQDEHGRVLLQQRGDDGLWGTVGGALEPGEDFLSAAHRELHEETGLTCPHLALLPVAQGVICGPEFHHCYPNGHEIYLLARRAWGTLPAAALEHAQPDDSGETVALAWFALDDLPNLSSNINISSMNLLRAQQGLTALPLHPTSPPPPPGNYLGDLREVVGTRPLFAAGANVIVTDSASDSASDQESRLLLLRHAGTGRWILPGGGLELGERLEDCAARELHEETGLRAAGLLPLELFAGAKYRFTYPHGDVIDPVSMLFLAQGISGTLNLQAEEVLEAKWFSVSDLPTPSEVSGEFIQAMIEHWVTHQDQGRF